jgi:hypothetical protein
LPSSTPSPDLLSGRSPDCESPPDSRFGLTQLSYASKSIGHHARPPWRHALPSSIPSRTRSRIDGGTRILGLPRARDNHSGAGPVSLSHGRDSSFRAGSPDLMRSP